MLEKYVEEKYPPYLKWGRYPDGDVNITNLHSDSICKCSEIDGDNLIADRAKIIKALCILADAFDKASPDEFKRVWYTVL